jgi:hypothetical protein
MSKVALKFRGSSQFFDYAEFLNVRKGIKACLVAVLTTKGAVIVGYSSVGLVKAKPGFITDPEARLLAPDQDLAVMPSLPDKAILFEPDYAFSFGG